MPPSLWFFFLQKPIRQYKEILIFSIALHFWDCGKFHRSYIYSGLHIREWAQISALLPLICLFGPAWCLIVCWAKQLKNGHFLEQGLVQSTILIHNSYGKFIIVMTKFFSWVKRVKNQAIIYTYLFIYLTLKEALKYSTIWKCLKLQNRTLKV